MDDDGRCLKQDPSMDRQKLDKVIFFGAIDGSNTFVS